MRIGIIGASRIAMSAIIGPAHFIEGLEVAGIAARDQGRADAFAAEHQIARVFAGYDALLADPNIDLVYIGTPPSTHAELALATIRAGKPVLVEKPFALTSAEAQHVHDVAQAAGLPVFEAMHAPHHRLFERVLEIIRNGEIGRVLRVEAKFDAAIDQDDPIRWNASLGGGALMDLGVYLLAWLRRIAGESFRVTRAEAELRNGVDARFTATLSFANGVVGEISSSMLSDALYARLFVEGDQGTIEVINPLAPQLGHLLMITANGAARNETVEGPTTYEAQLAAVRDACQGAAPFPFASDDYVRSMEAIERVRTAFIYSTEGLSS